MALKGLRVIELAGLAPGPFCGMILADFGASVIRVDKINQNTGFDCLGNGKRSICLDLKNPQGVQIFRRLCSRADIVLEPFRQGVMEKLGLGPDTLLKDNPSLIYARLTGYGQTGPFAKNAGHDINYVALSGLLSFFGRQHENPFPPINLAADFGGGGLMCALGILLALFERSHSGVGQVVDNSMVRGTAYLGSWLYRSQNLPVWGQERGKNILDSGAHFYEVYKTKDGKFMSVGALEPQFYEQLIEGLGLNEEEAPQIGDFEALKKLFTKNFSEKTRDEWCQIFDTTDACVAPVLDIIEAPKHPHNINQNTFVDIDGGSAPQPAPTLSRTPGKSMALSKNPSKGEHTKEILLELGYTEEFIRTLENEEAIKCYINSKM